MLGMLHARGVLVTCLVTLHVALGVYSPAAGGRIDPSECRSLMDLYIVIDGSDSISAPDFVTLQKAIASLVPQIDLGSNKARIGMLVYSSNVPLTSEHPFSDSAPNLLNAAMKLDHPRDGTNTALGIKHMRNMFQTYGRQNVPWTCVVVTDGISKDPAATAFESQEAAKMGINMFAVGIGHRIALAELANIASSEKQVITIDNFNQLSDMLASMMTRICPCPIPPSVQWAKCMDGARAIGTVRNYQCLDGYLQRGNGQITCQDDFSWTPLAVDFECLPCSDVTPVVQHGTCGGGDILLGSLRTYTCQPGYLAVGNPEITCLNDATWSVPDFQCIPCGETPIIQYGTCGGGDYTIGSVRSLTCNPGYLAVGTPEIRCLGNAQWSRSDFQCIPCGETPIIPHGTCGGGDYTIGAQRIFTCDPGYLAVGNPMITCDASAQWTMPQFQCIPCGETPTIAHGTCGGGDYIIGAQRTFMCDVGYLAVGNPVITCDANAQWTMPDFKCIPCGDTPVIQHGTCGGGDYIIGAQRTFVCEPGYLPVGDPVITCDASAQWTVPQFQCVPCGDTPAVTYGTCGGGDYTIGARRMFTCLPGYKPEGDPYIECLSNALWSQPSFRCVPCGEPPVLQHATCGGGDYTIGARRSFVCDNGYLAIGNPDIECMSTAMWSVPDFQCVPCGETPVIANGVCGGGDYTIGASRVFQCNPGYLAIGNPNTICQADATWSRPDFQCVPCGATPVIPHALCGSGEFTIGTQRLYTCEPGYKAVGSPYIECNINAMWTEPSFQCVPCGDTPLIEHATCGGGDYTIGSRRMFTCDAGYLGVGDPYTQCLDDATWSAPNFRCTGCGETPLVSHGLCGGGLNTLGAIRSFTCDAGYLAVGNPDIQCLPDATWSLSDFQCIPCGETPIISHGSCGGGDYTIGARRQYLCEPGYLAVGDPFITCQNDATWTLPQFQCVPCGDTPIVQHGVCGGGDYILGARRIFTCEPGYFAVGTPDIVCRDDATWSVPDFKCIPCGETPLMQYATCGGGDFLLGSKRSYACDAGYLLVGNPEIQCLSDATWSAPDFKCTPCGDTPVIDNADCGGGDYLIGSKRTYMCHNGYIPVGNPEIECMGTATWSQPSFQCVGCGTPPFVANAYTGFGPGTIGSTVEYFCEAGYEMYGRGQLTCLASGVWEQPNFRCNVRTTTTTTTPSPIPTDPSVCDACRFINGVGYNNHPFDCNQYIQCFLGTKGMEPVYRRCPFGLFWDQNVLTCLPADQVDCPYDHCKNPMVKSYKHTDPNNCCGYWKCEGGRAYGECCGDGMSYNSALQQCVPDFGCRITCPFHDELPVCDKRPSISDTMYEQHIGNNIWVSMHCAPGTAFNPVDCDCSLILMNIPGKRRQQVCKPELYLPFTHGFGDNSGRNVYILPENLTIHDGAALFNGRSRILINRFSNTEFHGDLVIKFRYSDYKSGPYYNQLQALVTNGDCGTDPSIVVAKMPGYVLLGAKTDVPKSFALPTLEKEWKEVIYIHNEKKLEGRVCGASMSKWSYGPIQATHCGLQVGYGHGLQPYVGLLDDLYIYQCRPRAGLLSINY